MQNASAADDDDAEYEADGEYDECNNATIIAIPRTRIGLLGLMLLRSHSVREPPDLVRGGNEFLEPQQTQDLHDGMNYVQDLEQPPQSNLTEKFSFSRQTTLEEKVVSIVNSPYILNPKYQPIDHEHTPYNVFVNGKVDSTIQSSPQCQRQ